MENLKKYKHFQREFLRTHDCNKCKGKIVMISIDKIGNTYCGYCGQAVEYPRLTKEAMEKMLKEIK